MRQEDNSRLHDETETRQNGGSFAARSPGAMGQPSGLLDDWLAIETDGTIVVFSGKVELGTGVRTALAQIVAEELDVSLASVRMVMGDTAHTPDEGYTAGSKTIQTGGVVLRRVAAEVRRVLLDLAADQLEVAQDDLITRDGAVEVRGVPDRRITYATLIGGRRFERSITGHAPLKRPDEYHIVGTAVPRLDLPHKFTGAASFVQDVRLPGMLHGRVVRPAGAGATLMSLGASALPDAQVIRIGSFVGVVAEREEVAIRAAQQLPVTWHLAPPLPPMEELFQYIRSQPTTDQVVLESGEVEEARHQSTISLEATYTQPFQAHASLGPSCAVAEWRDGAVTVWCSSQGVFPLQRALADLLELPVERVRVIHVEGAGCYGQNGSDDVAADAALLARAADRPVRVQWMREDEFVWEPKTPAMVIDLRGALDADSHISAWSFEAWSPSHMNRPRGGLDFVAGQLMHEAPARARDFFAGGDRNALTNYALASQRVTMHWLAGVPLRSSSMRSLGATANTFANESFIDELAAACGADPLAFRLGHLDDPRARAVLVAAARRAQWGDALPAGEGRGIAFARYENREAYVATVAHVRVDAASGLVRLLRMVVAHDCGLIINHDGVRNQIEGNVIQSASRALKEEVRFETTGVVSRDWETYPILTFSELPTIDIELIERPEDPSVGAGEPATVTTAPAIANAIFAAVGARVRQIPFTAARVRQALGAG